jgi:uncharacterized membrane protein
MVEVILYSRPDCHLCEIIEQELEKLKDDIPHRLSVVNIDDKPGLSSKYGLIIPVVEIGPYIIKSPIDPKDLEITLRAAQYREHENASIDKAIEDGVLKINIPWTASDRFFNWLSQHYLGVFNLFVLIYLGLPFLAPVLMRTGMEGPASWIYRAYGLVCHQLAFRSWFLYGEQTAYPREAAGVEGVISYSAATSLDEADLWTARLFTGDERVGYKVALCQRDIAIYGGILSFGLIFSLFRKRIRSIPWYVWIIFGIIPIGIDGLSQLVSQPPFNLISYRESTPELRLITGFLFGFMTAWFGYPLVEESMKDTREYLQGKFERVKRQKAGAFSVK